MPLARVQRNAPDPIEITPTTVDPSALIALAYEAVPPGRTPRLTICGCAHPDFAATQATKIAQAKFQEPDRASDPDARATRVRSMGPSPTILPYASLFATEISAVPGRSQKSRVFAAFATPGILPAWTGHQRPATHPPAPPIKSGLLICVRERICSRRHVAILAWSPESRTSGTVRPIHSRGLV